MEKKKYQIGADNYVLYEEIGKGGSAAVHRALCIEYDEIVAIKILDFEQENCDLNNVFREAQTMVLVDHPNVLKSHCSFVHDHSLWVVIPFMAGGSCLHILKAAHPDGFEEVVIATILHEVLKGLEYLHDHGHIHRDVKAGNILLDSHGGIKLGDFGVSACLFDSGDRTRMRNTFVGTPCWMAPEVMEQVHGYDFKADIWSFGITSLELAHGHAPFSKYPPMKVLLMTLQHAPPGLDYERDTKFSKSFKQMIASCLVKDPSKRPSAKKLLRHSFFKKARSSDYIRRTLLDGLPPDLGERLKALKEKEEDMLAQSKMPDGQKEEMSQHEYNRGISGWDFDLDDLKAQATLIQDEDLASEEGETTSMVNGHGRQLSCSSQYTEAKDSDNNHHAPLSLSSFAVSSDMANKEISEDDESIVNLTAGLQISQISPRARSQAEINISSTPEDVTFPSQSKCQTPKMASSSDATTTKLDDASSEIVVKTSKASANSNESDEKTKPAVVHQRGRFKVTSESAELEKGAPPPLLQKSHSLQVISQHPAVVTQLQSEATRLTLVNHPLFPMVQSVLQTNVLQRDHILSLMKQMTGSESTGDGVRVPVYPAATEKSLLEAAHDREKELHNEITDLKMRYL
ncbi:hypothetical protein Leryth_016913 [Lithospermum erythrorhizon]|nr:hypothetical protein Leryth_016913 [Lithospermum erythrorhizon]